MKNAFCISFLFLCLFLTMNHEVYAQDAEQQTFNTRKTELNISVSNIFSRYDNYSHIVYFDEDGYVNYSNNINDYHPVPEIGIGLKFHTDMGAFRLRTNIYYSNLDVEFSEHPDQKNHVRYLINSLNFGYEWHLQFERIVFLYGGDLSSSYIRERVKIQSGDWTGLAMYNETDFGINPLVGVNIFVTPHLSIGTEARFTVEYASRKITEKSESSTFSYEYYRTMKGLITYFGPIGFISVNVYF